jgi:hypothetical protein
VVKVFFKGKHDFMSNTRNLYIQTQYNLYKSNVQETSFGQQVVRYCQMVCFQTKNPNLGNFWSALDWKMLKYFMAIWNILMRFGKGYVHLVHFVFIWYIFPVSGTMYQVKSGNPALFYVNISIMPP